jgi:hypothetical protein
LVLLICELLCFFVAKIGNEPSVIEFEQSHERR